MDDFTLSEQDDFILDNDFSNKDNEHIDALEVQRQQDIKAVEKKLKRHSILGDFFTKYWEVINTFIRVEEYHKDVLFLKHGGLSRKIFILVEGDVSAYIQTRKTPKPIEIHKFIKTDILSELNGLLGDHRYFGFKTDSDCRLVAIDLDYVEDQLEEANSDVYVEFIDLLYDYTGHLTANLCNIALEKKLELRNMLRRQNFFANIDNLDDKQLCKLADNMKYIFLSNNEILIDEVNNNNIYLVEAGTVSQTKRFTENYQAEGYLYTRNIQSVYVNNNQENLQDLFNEHYILEQQINNYSEFDKALDLHHSENIYKHYKIRPENDLHNSLNKKVFTITEHINRFGLIGEDLLSSTSNIEISAITETSCCLIEIDSNYLINKQSILNQLVGFFNNKINYMQNNIINKQKEEIKTKVNYISLLNFSLFFMVIMAILGVSGTIHTTLELPVESAILHRSIVLILGCFLLTSAVKKLSFNLEFFGLTTKNLRPALWQAALGVTFLILTATALKEIYVLTYGYQYGYKLYHPDLVISNRFGYAEYFIFLILYIIYEFIFKLCTKGVLQNIFWYILEGKGHLQYWGSILAASLISSQFHMSLFHDFSFTLFFGSVVSGVVYANTRNFWGAFLCYNIFSLYLLTILGLIPGSHY